jgi:hypothetical protein
MTHHLSPKPFERRLFGISEKSEDQRRDKIVGRGIGSAVFCRENPGKTLLKRFQQGGAPSGGYLLLVV